MNDTSFTSDPGPPPPPKQPEAQPPIKKKSSKWVLILLLLLVTHVVVLLVAGGIGIGIGIGVSETQLRTAQRYDSFAVLPFYGDWNPAGAGDNWPERRREYLEVTLPDALSGQIAKRTSGEVKVMATHEIRGRHHPNQAPRQFGRELGVRAVLSGHVTKGGRMTVQLISVDSGELLWSNSYNFVQVDPAPRWALPGIVEGEICDAVANRLRGQGIES